MAANKKIKMKKLATYLSIIFCSILFNFNARAQNNFTSSLGVSESDEVKSSASENSYDPSDPIYDWSQVDTKKVKVELKRDGLVLESKNDESFAMTIAELPINIDEQADFMYGVTLNGPKLDDKSSLGIIFDYENARNYKGMAIFKKQFEYFIVKDGVLSSVKTGLVKMKGNTYTIMMTRKNGKTEFTLNDLELCTLKNITLTNEMFGAYVRGKLKVTMSRFYMDSMTEESGTTND